MPIFDDLRNEKAVLDRMDRESLNHLQQIHYWQTGWFKWRCPDCDSLYRLPRDCPRCGGKGLVEGETITTGDYL